MSLPRGANETSFAIRTLEEEEEEVVLSTVSQELTEDWMLAIDQVVCALRSEMFASFAKPSESLTSKSKYASFVVQVRRLPL
jgi:hypothetical protein